MTQEQKKFIERVGALAAADMQKSGVLASLTIAQAILESGWGKSGLTVKGNALFGIKAGTSWTGAVYSGKTQECYDGVTFTTVTGLFRAYGSWAESVADHSDLLSCNARYKAVIGERDYKAACRAIAAAGYATDPKYADKLVQIIEAYALTAYDGAGSAAKPGGSNTTAGTTSPADAKGAGKMKASEFINKLQNIVDNYKTLYVMGCFGAPLTGANVSRYCTNHRYNKQAARTAMIRAAADKNPPVYGFDCVCLIKGVLWGWSGNAAKPYGGAAYASNGVPDLGADTMITKCSGVSADFSGIVPGEAVWLPGHIGVYIGGGKVIECSPAFKNCVQVTACLNIGAISRHERAQVDEAREVAVYHLRHRRRRTGRRRKHDKAQRHNYHPGDACVRCGRRGALYGQHPLHQRGGGKRRGLQAGNGKGNGTCKGRKAPLPPYQTARRRFYRLRLGQCGGRAGRRERYDRRRKCASVQR